MSEPAVDQSDAIAQRIVIPPTPEALMVIAHETSQEEPNVDEIITVLKKDVGLYSAILQVVNSPFMGVPNKVTSIEQGVMLLGIPKVASVTRSVSVRANLGEPKGLPNFWETATEVAELCSLLTKQLTGEDPTTAYALGMFHSCGVPVMMQGFKDYPTVLQSSIRNTLYPLHWLEKARYGFSNHQVAARLTEKWFMPEEITAAILYQGTPTDILEGRGKAKLDDIAATWLSILTLAVGMSPKDRLFWHRDAEPANAAALEMLEIAAADFSDVENFCLDAIADS